MSGPEALIAVGRAAFALDTNVISIKGSRSSPSSVSTPSRLRPQPAPSTSSTVRTQARFPSNTATSSCTGAAPAARSSSA